MSKFNILYKICGSIAAYKSAYLISKLIQNDFDVRVVVTASTLNFIGEATLEGLTGKSVFCDSFKKGQMMSHIDLVKWADLTIVAPATGNTINKLASGISDNLLTSLFLAHDWTKPYLIAPAMNTKMYEHPATVESIKKLTDWGVKILPTDSGFLACGDEGNGKLLDPDKIFEYIQVEIASSKSTKKGNIIITSGGTTEDIDNVRHMKNISSGRTGAIIAENFIRNNYGITYLHSSDALKPKGAYISEEFHSFKDLDYKLKSLLRNNDYDAIIHLAAVSDYTPTKIFVNDNNYLLPLKGKISSQHKKIKIEFIRNDKIVNNIKNYSKNKRTALVSFKLTNDLDSAEISQKVNKIIKDSKSDIVVHNDLKARTNGVQKQFNIYCKGKIYRVETAKDLSKKIEELIIT